MVPNTCVVTGINNHSTQPSPLLPSSQLIQVTTTNAALSNAPAQPVQVMPVTLRRTVYYVPPPVVSSPAVAGTTTQPSSCLPRASAPPFVPPSLTACVTLPEVAELLASTKKD